MTTTIRLETYLDGLGGHVAAAGHVTATSSAPRRDGARQIQPHSIRVDIADGRLVQPLSLEPTDGTWYWIIAIYFEDARRTIRRDVLVPDIESVDWADLIDVDPKTVQPLPVVPPTAVELVEEARATLQAASTHAQAAGTARAEAVDARDLAIEARQAAERARDEAIVAVSPLSDWSGTIELSLDDIQSRYLHRRLVGNVSLILPSATEEIAWSATLKLYQDAVGGRSIRIQDASAAFRGPITLSTSPNAIDLVRIEHDGYGYDAFYASAALGVPPTWIGV